MSKSLVLVAVVGLTCISLPADDNVPPGLQKKGGVPPGLAKKGGVPPGQAKKQDADDAPAQVAAANPAAPSAPAPATPAPAAPKAPAAGAPVATAATPAPAPTPATPAGPTASVAVLKAKIDHEVETIKDRVADNHLQSTTIREISRLTGVPVQRLEQQQHDHQAGFPALLLANLICKEKNASFNNLMEERKQGTSWGTIAQRRNMNLQPLLDNLIELKRHLNQVQKARS